MRRKFEEQREVCRPFLEETVHESRVIYTTTKRLNDGSYSIITIKRDIVFQMITIEVYIPKTSRRFEAVLKINKLIDCSESFFDRVFKEKHFFFANNSLFRGIFPSYLAFVHRHQSMAKDVTPPTKRTTLTTSLPLQESEPIYFDPMKEILPKSEIFTRKTFTYSNAESIMFNLFRTVKFSKNNSSSRILEILARSGNNASSSTPNRHILTPSPTPQISKLKKALQNIDL